MGSLKHSPAPAATPKTPHFNSGRVRTRPCVYCGAHYYDIERLHRHEEACAARFKEERMKLQKTQRIAGPIPGPGQLPATPQPQRNHLGQFVSASQAQLLQLPQHPHPQCRPPPPPPPQLSVAVYRIDRTVEEFGEDWEEERGTIYPPFHQPAARARRASSGGGLVRRYRNFSANTTALATAAAGNNNQQQQQKLDTTAAAALASLRPAVVVEQKDPDFQSLEENSWITFEPGRMPRMPEAKIVVQSGIETYLSKLSEEEWVRFIKEQLDPSPPPVKEDPNRMDCRHCGLIFNEVHVRKFHEDSHQSEQEAVMRQSEAMRTFCGFCGQTFGNVTHRKIHEKAHMSLQDPNFLTQLPQFPQTPQPPAPRNHLGQFVSAPPGERRSPQKAAFSTPRPAKVAAEGRPRKYRESPAVPAKPRLCDQEGWLEDPDTLPQDWKYRTRPRATQAGQMFYLFLAPDKKIFHSRKKVMEHMELLGGYTQFDFDKVKQAAGTYYNVVKKKGEDGSDDDSKSSKKSTETPKKKKKREESTEDEEDWAPSKKKKKEVVKKDIINDHEKVEEKKTEENVRPSRSTRSTRSNTSLK